MSPGYVALIADVAASRALAPARRARLQAALRRALPGLDRRLRAERAARCGITLGDELQALLRTPAALWRLAHELRVLFPDIEWVIAAGRGPLTTPLRPGAAAPELDGPCFHRARAALERAKAQRLVFALDGFTPAVEPLVAYYSALHWSWTARQRRAAARWRWLEAGGRRDVLPPEDGHPSAASHLRRRLGWSLVRAGDAIFRKLLEAS